MRQVPGLKVTFADGWKRKQGNPWTGIEGNLPRWPGAAAVYHKAYEYMLKHGADDLLIEALSRGDEEAIKAGLLRVNEGILRAKEAGKRKLGRRRKGNPSRKGTGAKVSCDFCGREVEKKYTTSWDEGRMCVWCWIEEARPSDVLPAEFEKLPGDFWMALAGKTPAQRSGRKNPRCAPNPGRKCPMCAGPGVPLGKMGTIMWYRCRNCGWTYPSAKKVAAKKGKRRG